MSDIRVRGKRIDNEEWVESRTIITLRDIKSGKLEYYIPPYGTAVLDQVSGLDKLIAIVGYIYQVIPETIGEGMGLPDINNKEIFEGDIVRVNHSYFTYCAEVVRDRGCFWLDNYERPFETLPEQLGYHKSTHLEVIGNIHDSPELLAGNG